MDCNEKDFFIVGDIKEGKFKKPPSLFNRRKKTLKRINPIKKKISPLQKLKKKLYNRKYWRSKKNIIQRKKKLKGLGIGF